MQNIDTEDLASIQHLPALAATTPWPPPDEAYYREKHAHDKKRMQAVLEHGRQPRRCAEATRGDGASIGHTTLRRAGSSSDGHCARPPVDKNKPLPLFPACQSRFRTSAYYSYPADPKFQTPPPASDAHAPDSPTSHAPPASHSPTDTAPSPTRRPSAASLARARRARAPPGPPNAIWRYDCRAQLENYQRFSRSCTTLADQFGPVPDSLISPPRAGLARRNLSVPELGRAPRVGDGEGEGAGVAGEAGADVGVQRPSLVRRITSRIRTISGLGRKKSVKRA
ncbi:hypothetical protein HDZ31DRAFT_66187 [Schizophyllum fasciatum]